MYREQIFHFNFHVQKRNGIMASTSSWLRGKLVISSERRTILQGYNYFKKEEEAGSPRFKINGVLNKTSQATGYSYNVIGAVRQGKLKTPRKNVNRKQIKLDKLHSFDLGVIYNRLYLKNESPTLTKCTRFW